ncbi:MAG: xanthine dehydrogenase family protein molybdopterin-binding subunit, partial [Methylocystis sp.]
MKLTAVSGITLGVSRLALAETPAFLARETLPGRGVWKQAVGRVDGVAKVTGAKLYASDFRASDLPGWPANTSHALLLRAPDATHVYVGFDLARLGEAAQPSVVVTAEDLARIGARVPEFYAGDLFCPAGKTPSYLGQPVALLIFETFDAFDRARLVLRDGDFLKFGAETDPVAVPNYGAFRFTRVAGATPDAPDIYSPLQEGWVSPGLLESSGRPIWKPLPVAKGGEYVKGATHGEAIRARLAGKDPAVLTLDREFETQSVDPMFLEPECGLAWYDPHAANLEIVLGVQSPFEATKAVAFLLGEAKA